MNDDSSTGAPAGEADRQRAVDVLCQAFADDRIEVEEFERRVELAHRADTRGELSRLLAGVPGASPPVPHSSTRHAAEIGDALAVAAPRSMGEHALQPVESVRPTSFIAGILGGGVRKGSWYPARINYAMGVMGGFSLDLRTSPLPPGVTEIKLFCMWGGGEIIVPPDVRVDVSIAGIMGGFEYDQAIPGTLDPAAPVVRISGICLMGGAEIVVRYPGESSGDAKRRRRAEKKSRKLALKAAKKRDR